MPASRVISAEGICTVGKGGGEALRRGLDGSPAYFAVVGSAKRIRIGAAIAAKFHSSA
jgi:hypothetical protein